VQEEVLEEEAAVETSRAQKKRCKGWDLVVRRRGKPKERTKGNGESRKKLATAGIGMTLRAEVAKHKGRSYTGPMVEQRQRNNRTRHKVARRAPEGRALQKSRRNGPECNNGIRNQDFKEQLRLGSERTSSGIYRKALVPGIVRRTVRSSVRMRIMSIRTLWRSRPPPKRKKSILAA
jgi:hypothetical protein